MNIFIVYYSETGLTHLLAKAIARGVEEKSGAHAFLRRIPSLAQPRPSELVGRPLQKHREDEERMLQAEYAQLPLYSVDELKNADALVVGSPIHYAGISAPTKHFIESLTPLWNSGVLENKPAGAFVASGTTHGGVEVGLLSILSSLLSFSMLPVGLPFRAVYMKESGSIFGPTITADRGNTPNENLAELFGKRIAEVTFKLAYGKEEEVLKPMHPLGA